MHHTKVLDCFNEITITFILSILIEKHLTWWCVPCLKRHGISRTPQSPSRLVEKPPKAPKLSSVSDLNCKPLRAAPDLCVCEPLWFSSLRRLLLENKLGLCSSYAKSEVEVHKQGCLTLWRTYFFGSCFLKCFIFLIV